MAAYVAAYESGVSFSRFLEDVQATPELWRAIARRTTVGGEYLERVRRSGGSWRLLVLADDWCGDAVNSLPVIARLVEAHPEAELRIVPRDAFPEIRDRHRTNGARSIPIAILLDGEGRVRGSWGPRPAELQAWFERELRDLPDSERYRALRRWYARDRGATTAREVAKLFERAARPLGAGTSPS